MEELKLVEVQTFVSDLQRAKQFYEGVLGFQTKQAGDKWVIYDLQGMEFVIQSGGEPTDSVSEYGKQCTTMMVLATKNIEKAVEDLKAKGVSFFGDIVTVPQGRFIGFKDPDGNVIELAEQNRD